MVSASDRFGWPDSLATSWGEMLHFNAMSGRAGTTLLLSIQALLAVRQTRGTGYFCG